MSSVNQENINEFFVVGEEIFEGEKKTYNLLLTFRTLLEKLMECSISINNINVNDISFPEIV
jgi:hypothetical protein